jgi:hypothetical protein
LAGRAAGEEYSLSGWISGGTNGIYFNIRRVDAWLNIRVTLR